MKIAFAPSETEKLAKFQWLHQIRKQIHNFLILKRQLAILNFYLRLSDEFALALASIFANNHHDNDITCNLSFAFTLNFAHF